LLREEGKRMCRASVEWNELVDVGGGGGITDLHCTVSLVKARGKCLTKTRQEIHCVAP